MYNIPEYIVETSRYLRKNMTDSEKKIWEEIKGNKLGYKFLRQKPIYIFTENNGQNRFIIADFYNVEKKLILEIDGSIHNLEEIIILDREKEKLLKKLGYKILRIKNEDIDKNIFEVLGRIKEYLT